MSKRVQTLSVPQQALVVIHCLEKLKKKNKDVFPQWIDASIEDLEIVLQSSSKLQLGKQIIQRLKNLLFT